MQQIESNQKIILDNKTNTLSQLKQFFTRIRSIPIENKLAFLILILIYAIVWLINIGEYKTYIFNYSFFLALAGIVSCLACFFYTFAQLIADIKSKNWFTVGLDILFNLSQVLFFVSGVRELTQRSNPFNTILFFLFGFLVYFAQIYINKSFQLFKITIICSSIIGFIALIFKALEINTPSDYLYLIWAIGSYAIFAICITLFFVSIRFTLNNLTKS